MIAIAPVLNEEGKINEVVRRVPRDVVDETLVVDDGSTDRSAEVARELGAQVLSMGATVGVGAALRASYAYALKHDYDVAVVMAGNNKDSPEEIPLLLDPIAEDRADFVQGSRFLKAAANFGDMPLVQKIKGLHLHNAAPGPVIDLGGQIADGDIPPASSRRTDITHQQPTVPTPHEGVVQVPADHPELHWPA